MNAVLVDAGGWMARADRNDPAHPACTAARDATLEADRILITTDLIVGEALTLVRFRLGRSCERMVAADRWQRSIAMRACR